MKKKSRARAKKRQGTVMLFVKRRNHRSLSDFALKDSSYKGFI